MRSVASPIFSTGELGVQLCNELVRAGFDVLCFKGSGATHPCPGEQCHLSLFNTSHDLLYLLEAASTANEITAVFHVAALCDYKIKRVEDDQGQRCISPKITSRSSALTIRLEPATKVISKMRRLFSEALTALTLRRHDAQFFLKFDCAANTP